MNNFAHCFPIDPMLRGWREHWSVQNQRCYLCGRVFIDGLEKNHWLRPTREHVFPKSGAGYGLHNNILLAHQRCNKLKADRPPHACEVLYLEVANEIMTWRAYERERAKSYEVRNLPVVG